LEQLTSFWNALLARWWFVVALALAGAAAGYLFSSLQTPLYRSSGKLYIMPAKPDQGVTYFSQNVVRQFGQIAVSDQMLRNVGQVLKLDMSPGEMREKVTASGNVENLIVFLTVDDSEPARAQQIAQQLMQEFIRDNEARMRSVSAADRVDVRAYDDATPAGRFRPQTLLNSLASGLLGLLLGTALALFFDFLDDTIRGRDDTARLLGLPILGHIPAGSK